MMPDEQFQIACRDLLQQQQTATVRLLKLLKQEYETLSTSQAASLDDITHEKQPVILSLDKLNQQWLALLSSKCADMTPDGITHFLAGHKNTDDKPALSTLWLELQSTARACKKANTVNGSIIALRHQSTQKTMAILRGQIPGNTVYDPHGNSATGYAGGNAIAKA